MPQTDFVIITPPMGTAGVCSDYDEDCLSIPSDYHITAEAAWAYCWSIDPERGQCPFVD